MIVVGKVGAVMQSGEGFVLIRRGEQCHGVTTCGKTGREKLRVRGCNVV